MLSASGGRRCGLSRYPGKAAKAVLFNPSTGAGINTTALTLIVLAILVMVNYIAGRHKHQIDLTRQHLYTLSPQTKEVVKNLKDEVQITAIYQLAGRRGFEGQRARDLLQQYKDVSPKIKFEMLDPVADPAKAMAKGVQTMDVIWVESGGRKETVYTVGEQEVSSAILKVTRPERRRSISSSAAARHESCGAMASPTRRAFWRS